ncbi:hypothetical protein ACLOJK_028405 [Asimina triloba]
MLALSHVMIVGCGWSLMDGWLSAKSVDAVAGTTDEDDGGTCCWIGRLAWGLAGSSLQNRANGGWMLLDVGEDGGGPIMWSCWPDLGGGAGRALLAVDVDDEMGFNPSGFGRSYWRDAPAGSGGDDAAGRRSSDTRMEVVVEASDLMKEVGCWLQTGGGRLLSPASTGQLVVCWGRRLPDLLLDDAYRRIWMEGRWLLWVDGGKPAGLGKMMEHHNRCSSGVP